MQFSIIEEFGLYYVALYALYRDFDGFEYGYSGTHFHGFESATDAERLLERILKADHDFEHFRASKHWLGGSRMTYQSFCEGFAAGVLHEDGHLVGNRASQHYQY